MIITAQAPTRISLFGGGTDVDPYCSFYGGRVINMAITLRQHVMLGTGDDMFQSPLHDIPFAADPKLLYEILGKYHKNGIHGVKVKSNFDGCIRAGLGSSASFTVALLGALQRQRDTTINKLAIAQEAWMIETQSLGWHGGKQDQYAASFGGVNLWIWEHDTRQIPLRTDNLSKILSQLILFYIGHPRDSFAIQKEFKELTPQRKKVLDEMKKQTTPGKLCLETGDIEGIADLLQDAWKLKKEANKLAITADIENLYSSALQFGAKSAKILGAGGGGYMLFVVPTDQREDFLKNMREKHLEDVDFSLDYNGLETRII